MSTALVQFGQTKLARQPRAALLDPQKRERAAILFPLVEQLVEAQKNGRAPRGFRGTLDEFAAHLGRQVPISASCRKPKDQSKWDGFGKRQMYELANQFRVDGFEALAPDHRGDKGRSRSIRNRRVEIAAKDAYLNRASRRQAFKAAVAEARRIGCKPPKYGAIRRLLNSESKAVEIYAREGEEAFSNKCEPYMLQQPPAPMHTWFGDHALCDGWVFNDLWDDRRGEAIRAVLTALLDHGSRKIVGFAFCVEPSSHSISSALRMAVASFGPPRTLRIDNGKDFRKVGRIGLSPEASGAAVRLGIGITYAQAYNLRSKAPLERLFGTYHKDFDTSWGPFYCGRSPETRPDACSEALKEHEAYSKGKRDKSPLPLASEYVRLAAAWIEEYNAAPHSALNDRSPNEVFDAAWPPESRQPIDPRKLDPLLWDRQRRRVSEGGCIQLFNARFEPADPESYAAIFPCVGRDIVIAADPYNLGDAVALDTDGHFLGVMRAQKLLEQGPQSHEEIRAASRLRRRTRRAVAEYVQHIAAERQAYGIPTRLEALRQRALAATGTDPVTAAAPGARLQLPQRASYQPETVFNDDAAKRCIAAMKEDS